LDKTYNIYSLIDPRTNQVRYIGQTERETEKRYKAHLATCRGGTDSNLHKCRWLKQLEKEGYSPVVKVLFKDIPEDKVDNIEIEIIKHYKQFSKLTNITKGGRGYTGEHSEKTKELFKAQRKNRDCTHLRKRILVTNIFTRDSKIYKDVYEASKEIGVTPNHMLRYCEYNKTKNYNIKKTYHCTYINDNQPSTFRVQNRSRQDR
jgi:hypothetical protein